MQSGWAQRQAKVTSASSKKIITMMNAVVRRAAPVEMGADPKLPDNVHSAREASRYCRLAVFYQYKPLRLPVHARTPRTDFGIAILGSRFRLGCQTPTSRSSK